MKNLNCSTCSMAPRDGAESVELDFEDDWFLENATRLYRKRIFVCWADEARILGAFLSNPGTSAATARLYAYNGSGRRIFRVKVTLGPGESVLALRKQMVLKKGGWVDLYCDSEEVSAVLSGYYTDGYDWFHLRAGAVSCQVDFVEDGGIRAAAANLQAELREADSLRASQMGAQVEDVPAEVRQAATKIQVEYTV